MKNAPRYLVALAALVLQFAGCDQAPTQPELTSADAPPAFNASGNWPLERIVEERISDFSDVKAIIECEDGIVADSIQLAGQLYVRNTLLIKPPGGYTFTEHTMPIDMRGISLTTGEEFRVSERQIISASQYMGHISNYRVDVKFFSKDSKAIFRMVTHAHYTVNANGAVIVERGETRYVCEF